ncbi:GGDEF domain-containing protein [Thiomicrorhabdus cannonii]|uniref:GGDEF domain-containing protein n=1 Tax=Thiomicrorhabdus cannonii TaxID=2748011 RepID=UPI0015BF2C6B|nr:GGDEF domain-containing protein [Thiomicrorhabdus cannonii]
MFIHTLWLLALSGLAWWQSEQILHWPAAWLSLLDYAPYGIVAVGLFVGVFLNRIRPVAILLVLALSTFAFNYYAAIQPRTPDIPFFFVLLGLALPLNLFLWLFWPERGVRHWGFNLLTLAVLVLQMPLLQSLVYDLPPHWVEQLSAPISQDPLFVIHMPMVTTVVAIVLLNLMVVRMAMMRKPKVLDQVVLFVLVLMAYALNNLAIPELWNWMATIAALMVVLSLVFDVHQMAYTDELTGMAGRRALFESFMGLGRSYTVAMVDVDHFKKFNDTYGHDIGDLVLQTVSRVLSGVGGGGKAYRFGGEEFSVVFAGKTPEQAKPVLEVLRKQLETTELKFKHHGKDTTTKVTVSIGVAERNASFKTPEEVIKAADQALYQAKEAGRNRVVVFGEVKEVAKGQKSARIRKRKA